VKHIIRLRNYMVLCVYVCMYACVLVCMYVESHGAHLESTLNY
jgi:hypothetical protein